MTAKEKYALLDGDFDEVLKRLGTEERVDKLLQMFTNDKSAENLENALKSGNYDDAFMAAHTMKGIALNLGLTNLFSSAFELTELLRAKSYDERIVTLSADAKAAFDKVCEVVNY